MRNIKRLTWKTRTKTGTAASSQTPAILNNSTIFDADGATVGENPASAANGPLASYRIIASSDDTNLATKYATIIECLGTAEAFQSLSADPLSYNHDDLVSDAIDDVELISAVSSLWHNLMEPRTTYAADGETRLDQVHLPADLAVDVPKTKKARSAVSKRVPAKRAHRDLRDLQDRLVSKKAPLMDVEVLDVILAPFAGARNSRLIAERLLTKFGTFGKIVNAGFVALMSVDGLGREAAVALTAVGAAALHMLRKAIDDGPRIRMHEELMKYVVARLQNERVEVLFVIFLDASLKVIADEELSRGSIDHTPGYPREVVKRCLELDATSCFLVHNHPSGVMKPSLGDIAFTKAVVNAAQAVGIVVHDHLVVGKGECFSFRHNSLMN